MASNSNPLRIAYLSTKKSKKEQDAEWTKRVAALAEQFERNHWKREEKKSQSKLAK